MTNLVTHIVVRPFEVAGKVVPVGEAVNASSWKNTDRLVTTKYLRPMNEVDYARLRNQPPPSSAKPVKRFLRKG